MKPPKFDYVAPTSVEEATALLAQHGDDAKILAGGQSLMPMMSMRLVRPQVVVDVNRVGGLDGISQDNGALHIGALVRQRELERSNAVKQWAPVVAAAMPLLAHVQIRNRGTIGGSLAHADPAAELPALCVALNAEIVLTSNAGERIVNAEDFFISYLTTDLGSNEMLTQVRIPTTADGWRWSIKEICRREGDFALAGAVCLLRLDGDQVCQEARIVMFGVGDKPMRIHSAESQLRGSRLDRQTPETVARVVSQELDPQTDIHASSQYRKDVGGVVAKRALEAALAPA